MAWSGLPVDLLHCISSRLYIVDLLRLSAVCTSWNSALSNDTLRGIHCRPSPWLLLPSDVGEASDTLNFRDLTIEEEEGGVNIHYRFSSLMGYIFDRRCIGSKDGWLVTLDNMDLQPRIFNPLTKAEISLPSLFTIPDKYHRIKLDGSSEFFYDEINPCFETDVERFRDVYFRKIVMSSNDPFGTVVVIYGYIKKLALLRPNDKAWVLSPQLPPYDTDNYWVDFEDVYYHEEEHRFYAITHSSAVLSFDLSGQNVEFICPPIQGEIFIISNIMNYIAFLFGNLIKIEREVEYIDLPGDESMTIKTIRISVLKLLPDVNAWIPIKDLEDFSLFVGCNQTFSLHHTVASGIRPNCVYFTDNVEDLSPNEVTRDAGFFDLHNDCFHYFLDSDSQPNWPPSIWFIPSFS